MADIMLINHQINQYYHQIYLGFRIMKRMFILCINNKRFKLTYIIVNVQISDSLLADTVVKII